jgi:hypothetical protein
VASFVAESAARGVATVLVGMGLGVWGELYRGVLRGSQASRRTLVALDLAAWLGALALAAMGLYWANWLDLRLYAVAGMAVGYALTHWGAGPWLVAAGTALGRGASWLLGRRPGRGRPPAAMSTPHAASPRLPRG